MADAPEPTQVYIRYHTYVLSDLELFCRYKLLTLYVLYIVCGLIKLRFGRTFGRTSLVRVLFWPQFITWWGAQKAFNYADRPLTIGTTI